MDYQKEFKRLEESGSYWKPKVGQFKVKLLTELEESEPFKRKGKDGNPDEFTPQAKIKISVGEEEKMWTFGIGATPASTYGQLVKYAAAHGNKLLGVELSVIVKSDGTKNDYTIVQ